MYSQKPFPFSVGTRENAAVEEIASAAEVHVALLGGFSVTVNGQPVARPMAAAQGQDAGEAARPCPRHRLHRDVVSERLWPDAEPEAAANNLHQIVHAVRRMMGASVDHVHDDVVQSLPGRRSHRRRRSIRASRRAARSSTISLRCNKRSACGPVRCCPRIDTRSGQRSHRERLTETHAALVTVLGSKLFEQGQPEAALALLAPLAAARPLDEHLHRVLIDALADLGRRWEAIEAYERLRDALDEAYAAEPEPQTKAIYRRLLTGGKPMRATTRTTCRSQPPASSAVRRLLAELSARLARTRLLTLTGVGGVGKSRLALELARLAGGGNDFPDGIWLIELAGIQDPEVVASTVASALHITLRSGPRPTAALAEQLASRTLLLIMDNCEHLLDACSALVQEVLARCPGISVVTTSREPLARSRRARLPGTFARAA